MKKDTTRESLTTTRVDLMCVGVHKGLFSSVAPIVDARLGADYIGLNVFKQQDELAKFIPRKLNTDVGHPQWLALVDQLEILMIQAHHSLPHIQRIAKSGEKVTHEAHDCSGCADGEESDTAGSKAKGCGVEGVFGAHHIPPLSIRISHDSSRLIEIVTHAPFACRIARPSGVMLALSLGVLKNSMPLLCHGQTAMANWFSLSAAMCDCDFQLESWRVSGHSCVAGRF